ncbi:MAG: radical SAM protein, partial [Nanoarchaeota archaeon]|nr:radical SAM protein [Nanoarchaeota archaeon]
MAFEFFKKRLGQIRYVKRPSQALRYFTAKIKSIELALTFVCNFKCAGCYAEDLKTKKPTMLSKDQAVGFIKKYKPMHVNLTGGEPLIHPEIYNIIKEMPKSVVVSLVTNGSLLTKDKIKKLKDAGLNTIQISFGKNYPWDNLEKAKWAKEAGINACLSVTNTTTNKKHILAAIDYAEKNDIHVLWNLPAFGLVKHFDKETYFKYRNHPRVREDNMFWAGRNRCPAGREKIYITAKGELTPCDRWHKVYPDVKTMRKDFKGNKVWCTRLGDLH